MTNKIICGNTLVELKKLPDDLVDTIITSPPYWGLRDYGEKTKTIWGRDKNCKHKWWKTIPPKSNKSGPHGPNSNIRAKIGQDEVRRGSGSNFCSNCGAWYGQLGLEPTLDLYLEHLLEITIELKRVLKPTGVMFWNHGDCYGTGAGADKRPGIKQATNVGTIRKKPTKGFQKCLMLQNYRLVLQMISHGWILRNIIIWWKINHMPSPVKDRFTNAYESVFMLVKKKKYWFDLDAVRKPHEDPENKIEWHKTYLRKNSTKIGGHQEGRKKELETKEGVTIQYHPKGKNPGDVWTIPTQPFPEAHFATFPEKLIEPMILSSCPKKTGIALDPFMGSGTVAVVAKRLDRNYLGIEINPEYIKIAEQRIKAQATPLL